MDERIALVIGNLSPVDTEFRDDMSLKNDLGFDSLRLVELMVKLEESLQIEFDESDLDPGKLLTIADLDLLVCRYL